MKSNEKTVEEEAEEIYQRVLRRMAATTALQRAAVSWPLTPYRGQLIRRQTLRLLKEMGDE